MSKYKKVPNLLGYYFEDTSRVASIFYQIRLNFEHGTNKGISEEDIKKATREVNSARTSLDRATYMFVYDLNEFVFGAIPRNRVIMVIEGKFLGGEASIPYVFGIDFGINPHELFKKHPSDSYLTETRAQQYLIDERDRLRAQNLEGLLIEVSKFFYFDDGDVSRFLQDGKIDMMALLPLVTDTRGYVGVMPVTYPIQKEFYLENCPERFTSSRLKASLQKKGERKLTQRKIDDSDLIHDWAAHRIVVPSVEIAYDLETRLRRPIRIGNSEVRRIGIDDYYRKSKANEYKSFNIYLEVQTRGHKPCVREIQIVDKAQYYRNEIDPNDKAHHKQRDKKKQFSGEREDFIRDYRSILERILGRATVLINI